MALIRTYASQYCILYNTPDHENGTGAGKLPQLELFYVSKKYKIHTCNFNNLLKTLYFYIKIRLATFPMHMQDFPFSQCTIQK